MHILNAGRGAFLEFLRNLTPFVLLFSVSLLLHNRLDFRRIDLSNWVLTLAFFSCALTACFSFYANLSSFLDNAFSAVPEMGRGIRLLKHRGHEDAQLLWRTARLMMKRSPKVLFEALAALLVAYCALFATMTLGISGAVTAIRNGVR
jgi:hypothetical protein